MIWVGTSGYSYPEWRGSFYPDDFPTSQMFGYYSQRFSTVEINYTFYRMPSEKAVADWAKEAPPQFTFTLKASRRITHDNRLRECEDAVQTLLARSAILGNKLGVILFQLPPYLRRDTERLRDFTQLLSPGTRAAFEFRHPSWHSEDVYEILRVRGLTMCVTDTEDATTPIVPTAEYGYFRLRDEGYGPDDIARWADAVQQHAENWKDTFVYFKHEAAGKGPEFARAFLDVLGRE